MKSAQSNQEDRGQFVCTDRDQGPFNRSREPPLSSQSRSKQHLQLKFALKARRLKTSVLRGSMSSRRSANAQYPVALGAELASKGRSGVDTVYFAVEVVGRFGKVFGGVGLAKVCL